ncbi:MAG: hypothetical protein ABIS50_11550 [Luteolibacter sp.]|uniref:hypothetical protein n=1 Tax=Luteolibacter sp. TaxID=1962973 RepID=UPI00326510B1
MANSPPISEHAADRAKERFGLNRRAIGRVAAAALEHGISPTDTRGSLRRYLDVKAALHPGCEPVIHHLRVFVFGREDTLITVWELPHEFLRSAESAVKKARGTSNIERPTSNIEGKKV